MNITPAPIDFIFWIPPEGMIMTTGEETEIAIPLIPLPIKKTEMINDTDPNEKAIGDGVYEYLCRFPFCPHGKDYAMILQQAFPFLISDIASQLIVLDVKSVETEGQVRKIALLSILHHLEPENYGLLHKLGAASFDLALNYSQLHNVKELLKDARSWLEKARRINPDEITNLTLLGQVCYLMGNYHQCRLYWNKALDLSAEESEKKDLEARLIRIETFVPLGKKLSDSLEMVGAAIRFNEAGQYPQAREIMENLEATGDLSRELPNAEFFYILGLSREKCDDYSGAYEGYEMTLNLNKNHLKAQEARDRILSDQRG